MCTSLKKQQAEIGLNGTNLRCKLLLLEMCDTKSDTRQKTQQLLYAQRGETQQGVWVPPTVQAHELNKLLFKGDSKYTYHMYKE